MEFTVKYKVTSKRDPDKVFESVEEFWAFHDTTTTNDEPEERARLEGDNLLDKFSVLDEDGKSVIHTKIWIDEEVFNEYHKAITKDLIEEDEDLTFTRI